LLPGRLVFLSPRAHNLLPVVPADAERPPTSASPHGRKPVRSVQPTQSSTSSPIDRAVPRIELMAASTDSVLRSGNLSRAISSTCLAVTVPTLFLFGTPDPLAMLAAPLSNTG